MSDEEMNEEEKISCGFCQAPVGLKAGDHVAFHIVDWYGSENYDSDDSLVCSLQSQKEYCLCVVCFIIALNGDSPVAKALLTAINGAGINETHAVEEHPQDTKEVPKRQGEKMTNKKCLVCGVPQGQGENDE